MNAPKARPIFLLLAAGICLQLPACSASEDAGAETQLTAAPSQTTPSLPPTAAPGPAPSASSDAGIPAVDASSSPDAGTPPPPDRSAIQKLHAQRLTSFWENDTTIFQYAFARNNNDGYGYTVGRIGFTTATGDALEIVKCLSTAAPTHLLKKYEAALTALNAKRIATGSIQASTVTLDAIGSFTTDWANTANAAATKSAMATCQDAEVDKSYWAPSLPIVQKWGLSSALTRAAVYDSMVIHGQFNVEALAKQANIDTGNAAQTPAATPLSRAAESAWLAAYSNRRAALMNGNSAWRGSIARAANYERARTSGNFDFAAAFITDATASAVFPGKSYPSNGYQACSLNPDGSVTGPAQCTAPISN
jgi:chitosanase